MGISELLRDSLPRRLLNCKVRRREQVDAKDHLTPVTPDYLTKEFSKARDAAHTYDHVHDGEPPHFSRDPRIGAWLYEQQNFPQEYIQALMGHANEKMTKRYQEGHDEKEDRVPGGGRRIDVLRWEFCKSLQIAADKKGPTFR